MFFGIHDIDLLLWITGLSVKSLKFSWQKDLHPITGTTWFSIMEMDNGAVAVVENGWIMPEERAAGLDAGLKIVGTKV